MTMAHGFQRAVFNQATAAQFQVVGPPAAGKRIRVRGCILTAAGTQDVTFESDSTSLGAINFVAGSSFVLLPLDGGVGEAWLVCVEGEAVNITLGQAVQTDGVIFYDIV